MWLLADLFEELPEVGDVERPKLVLFLDEAHLLFTSASKAFLDSVTRTVRLIRSPGRGHLLRHAAPDRRAGSRARPARQPGAARPAGLPPRATPPR
jgi:DNA helicase HerA-like ATPase